MSQEFYTLPTLIGKTKMANALITGQQILFDKLLLGDGNGSYHEPTQNDTSLVNEVWRGNINTITQNEDNPNWIDIVAAIPATAGPFEIREVGILDTEGDLVAIGKRSYAYKPVYSEGSTQDIVEKFILAVEHTSVIQLKLNPTVAWATVKYVNDRTENSIKLYNSSTYNENTYADTNKYIFGREYLSAFHKKILNDINPSVKVIFSGDSTTYGDSIVASWAKIDKLVSESLLSAGILATVINSGHSSCTSGGWVRATTGETYSPFLPTDMAQNPNLYILRWGINDATITPEVGVSKLTTFINNMREGLTTFRQSFHIEDCSVIIMMPNSTNDGYGRNASWYESMRNELRDVARDFQCCFIDTYAYFQDSVNAGDWMDTPFPGEANWHIHPLDIMNIWIAGIIQDVIIPSGLKHVKTGMFLKNYPGGVSSTIKGVNDDSSNYYPGYSFRRCLNDSPYNWPLDGYAITEKHIDGSTKQELVSWENVELRSKVLSRITVDKGDTGFDWPDYWFGKWYDLTLQHSWVTNSSGMFVPGVMMTPDNHVFLRGCIKSGTLDQSCATLPEFFRPEKDVMIPTIGYDGSILKPGYVIILASTGEIIPSGGGTTFYCLDGLNYSASII